MELEVTFDAERFAAVTGSFLAAQVETNVIATVLVQARAGVYPGRNVFAYGTERGEVLWAAMRTPPWGMNSSSLPDGVADPLIERWLAVDSEIPWIGAVPDAARPLAAAWERLTGGRSELDMSEAIHVLDGVVDPPRPAAGRLRAAGARERGLLVQWWEAFAAEAEPDAPVGDAGGVVDRKLSAGHLLIWEDAGEAVSLVGINYPVAGVVRLGPVYTSPALRRRGYAGTAVAAVSRRALAADAARCMLYTDLANATSNKIYAEVGYRRVADWEKRRLIPA